MDAEFPVQPTIEHADRAEGAASTFRFREITERPGGNQTMIYRS